MRIDNLRPDSPAPRIDSPSMVTNFVTVDTSGTVHTSAPAGVVVGDVIKTDTKNVISVDAFGRLKASRSSLTVKLTKVEGGTWWRVFPYNYAKAFFHSAYTEKRSTTLHPPPLTR